MNASLFKSVHRAIKVVVPKIVSLEPFQSVLPRKIHYMCDRQRLNNSLNNPLSYNTFTFLQPALSTYNSICGMKVKGKLELRCKDCYYLWKNERKYVMCKTHPRHKQTQMMKRPYKLWIIASASQSKVRGW